MALSKIKRGSLSTGIDDNSDATAVTIDSSENLLVGKTARAANTAGIELLGVGASVHSYGGQVMKINRLTDDGAIVGFAKDDTTVGSIGCKNTYLFIGSSSVQETYIGFNNNYVYPADATGNFKDNAIDLGNGSARYDDVFATNTSITTSDEREKQQIASLTDAEMTAAKAISKLFKTFKWNDSVAENGDNARTHAGVIAQQVETAMTDAGLNAAHYAFWCSDTWWEADGETYHTADDAPDGAIERTRLGIRYAELLAFIGAATEQRLADIETRLTALEDA